MHKKLFFLSLLSIGLIVSCNDASNEHNVEDIPEDIQESKEDETQRDINESSASYQRGDLNIYPKTESVKFENASLSLIEPKADAATKSNEVNFKFNVQNYELGKITSDADGNGLANSDKGQHIHLILDNNPYSAHYEPNFTKTVEGDGNHVAIAFLSRSYHESVKHKDAYKVFQFSTGNAANSKTMDLNQPLLFYSRPKGEYKGKDAKKILFDFYLHNTKLSEDGNRVKLNINGKEDFYFSEWKPFIVEGLPMGENTFTIELVDANGNLAGPDFNRVSRTFTLSK